MVERAKREPKVTVTEVTVEETPVTEKRTTETLEESLDSHVLTEEEAIFEAKKAGIKPEVTTAVLDNRKYLIAGIGAIIACIIFVLGILFGLNIANGLSSHVAATNTEKGGMINNQGIIAPDTEAWLEGYKSGFVDGYRYTDDRAYYYYNNQYGQYGSDTTSPNQVDPLLDLGFPQENQTR